MYNSSKIASADGQAVKITQLTEDNHTIETLFVNHPEKYILCYSSQVGCNCGCQFCYSGLQHNLQRNLTADEIVDQCSIINELIQGKPEKRILFSAMGIGESLNNYRNYVSSVRRLRSIYDNCKFALATSGCTKMGIMTLAKDMCDIELKLTVSLHSAVPTIRRKLMPGSIGLDSLMQACVYYMCNTPNAIEFNVTLIDGINDSDKDAEELISLFERYSIISIAPVKINRFNHVQGCEYTGSSHIREFIDILRSARMMVEYYETNGSDIGGACGQMVAR